jgi:hypothetical protein
MRISAVSTLLFAIFLAGAARGSTAAEVFGLWLTEGSSARIEIFPCGDRACGRIAWLREPNTGQGRPKFDRHNPEVGKRNRPLLGLTLLWNFSASKDEPGLWEDGRVPRTARPIAWKWK